MGICDSYARMRSLGRKHEERRTRRMPYIEGPIRVVITGPDGDPFDGEFGSIIGAEMAGDNRMYRVKLDRPVKVPGLDEPTTDDLWSAEYLTLVSYEPEEEVEDDS